jgi:hypothetical protein
MASHDSILSAFTGEIDAARFAGMRAAKNEQVASAPAATVRANGSHEDSPLSVRPDSPSIFYLPYPTIRYRHLIDPEIIIHAAFGARFLLFGPKAIHTANSQVLPGETASPHPHQAERLMGPRHPVPDLSFAVTRTTTESSAVSIPSGILPKVDVQNGTVRFQFLHYRNHKALSRRWKASIQGSAESSCN